jgi:type II secretory ATPase GspE/PulE/Tfp pilus assembly ATPase PilB-like protein
MRGLEADGIAKVHAGVTTLEEVVRVARAQA